MIAYKIYANLYLNQFESLSTYQYSIDDAICGKIFKKLSENLRFSLKIRFSFLKNLENV